MTENHKKRITGTACENTKQKGAAVFMQLRELIPEVDTHTHTILSGHAWSTLRENCCAARDRGIKGLCLTEHGPAMEGGAPSFIPHSQRMLPREV